MNNNLIEELYNRIDNQEKIIRELQQEKNNTIDTYKDMLSELEQENKHLQDQLNQALKDYDNELQKNKKAIKYIKHKQFMREQITYKISYELISYELTDKQVQELLNILEGEDNE